MKDESDLKFKNKINLGDSSDDDQFPDPDVFTQLHLDFKAKTKGRVDKERKQILSLLDDLDEELNSFK